MKKHVKLLSTFCAAFVLSTGIACSNSWSFSIGEQPVAASDIAMLQKMSNAFASIAKEATPAVVSVRVEKSSQADNMMQFPFDFFNDPFMDRFFGPHMRPDNRKSPQKRKQSGMGSGFVISQDGYILTNNHVVDGADKIVVKFSNDKEMEAKVVGKDEQSDVAVIKVDAKGLHALKLGDSNNIQVGEWAIAVGNPFGLQSTVTVGVVSAKGRSRVGINDYEDFIQTDAAINPGNSGGPLLNLNGEVVGMNTAIFSRSGGYMGIGFAIPINMAKAVKEQLISSGKVTRGWLGVIIQDVEPEIAKSFGLKADVKGVIVAEVSKDSPAEKAGFKEGDIVLEMNGNPVTDVAELRNKVAMTPPGQDISFLLYRDGKRMPVSVKIGELSKELMASAESPALFKKVGISIQDVTKDIAEQLGYKNAQGVVVTDIEPGSPASSSSIKPGDLIEEINRKPVKNMKEAADAIASSKESKSVLLKIRQGNMRRFIAFSIE